MGGKKPDPRPIGDDEVITAWGTVDDPPISEPRWGVEIDVSVSVGDHAPNDAARLVRGKNHQSTEVNVRRVTMAGTLRAEGFVVEHKPSNRNHHHAVISRPDGWDTEKYDACYGELEVATPEADEVDSPDEGGR